MTLLDDVAGVAAPACNPEPFALATVPQPGRWLEQGRCRTVPPFLFFPERGADHRQAVEICRGCVVVEECRAYALAAGPDLHGIWGALTKKARDDLRRRGA